MKTQIENCEVTGTMLGVEDHGILTFFVYVGGDHWGCSFGGFAMDSWSEIKQKRVGSAFGCEAIRQILEVLEKDKWEDLKGVPCRAETEGLGGGIVRLGHLFKDKWVDLKSLASEHRTEASK